MGCAQSRVDNGESVARCKDRKCLMKEAVVARNAFAAAHSGYAISLKNTGAALSMAMEKFNPVTIKRTVSMPAMPVESHKEFDVSIAIEEDDDDEDEEKHHEGNDNDNKED
ncbi:hypothetical protein F3Y22_tig00111584pilonHSYRG00214 [Hibiscus syriacus]|uniref:DUF630 domain-containing protein n=1 Tax=Hibiscus syriacus TaxID=106335 RepID=A0A6A2YGU3_HIBSY|nr:hypothetical protein F3Y22_tig00111584pilonHSYRG00214 [Hibiscus syriacus]